MPAEEPPEVCRPRLPCGQPRRPSILLSSGFLTHPRIPAKNKPRNSQTCLGAGPSPV